jgi:hypothetical protein
MEGGTIGGLEAKMIHRRFVLRAAYWYMNEVIFTQARFALFPIMDHCRSSRRYVERKAHIGAVSIWMIGLKLDSRRPSGGLSDE